MKTSNFKYFGKSNSSFLNHVTRNEIIYRSHYVEAFERSSVDIMVAGFSYFTAKFAIFRSDPLDVTALAASSYVSDKCCSLRRIPQLFFLCGFLKTAAIAPLL
jgi:hypothetical protein